MVAAGRGDHAGWRDVALQQVGEGAAGLERARVLELLQLERQRAAGRPKSARSTRITGVTRTYGAMRWATAATSARVSAGGGPRPGRDAAGQAVSCWSAAVRPSSATEVSRILNFCTLPVTVIGNSSVNRT